MQNTRVQHFGLNIFHAFRALDAYEGWNFNSGNYLFTTDTK